MQTSDWQKLKSVTISNTIEDMKKRSYEKHFREQFAITSLKAVGPLLLSCGTAPLETCSHPSRRTNVQTLLITEQINGENNLPCWVNGLGWSHAMFILVLEKIFK